MFLKGFFGVLSTSFIASHLIKNNTQLKEYCPVEKMKYQKKETPRKK